jgi:transcriptional regulator with XRE-family HTH domain
MPRPLTPDPQLGQVMRELRQRAGRSQESIARDAGLSVTSYARIERGEANPTWTTVTQIARALDVSLAELGEAIERSRSC